MTQVPPDFPQPAVRQPATEHKSSMASAARGFSLAALVLLALSALVMAGSSNDVAPTGMEDKLKWLAARRMIGGLGAVAGGVLALVGLLLGLVGLTPQRRGYNSKSGMAWSGIAVVAALAVGLGYTRPKWFAAREKVRMAICADRVKNIGEAIHVYRMAQRDKPLFPPDLDALVTEDILGASQLHCPSSTVGRSEDYFYVPPGSDATDDTLLVAEMQDNHNSPVGGRYVLGMDGKCVFYSDPQFQEALQKPANRAFAEAWRAAGQP